MEDDESGGSSFNSSDGGSGSWSPSPSHKINNNQHVPNNREGSYARMEPKQLLSNDFYTRQFSRPRPEQSDEDFDEESEEEGDEPEQQQHEGHAGVNGEDDGSESDYDGVYEETQLLQQYNAAHYSKVDHDEKLRCRGPFEPATNNKNRHRLGDKQVYMETQLLDGYDLGCYANVQQEMRPRHIPCRDYSKDLEILQHGRVNADAETVDEAEPTEVVDSDAGTDDEAITSRQDQQEVLWKGKPNSEFRQERMCEFDMDLNVSLEEEMDCEFYGEPRNQQDTQQLVQSTDTQLVNQNHGWHGDTQLISSPGKEFLGNISTSYAKEMIPCETRGDVYSNNNSRGNAGVTKPSASSCLELPSVTTESKLLAIPSASEASEGSPFQCCVGTVHAESIRIAAMQPITWLPKLKPDDERDAGKSVYRPELLPLSEPEWMRDYGSRGNSQGKMKKNQEERIGSAPGSSSVQEFSFPNDGKASEMQTKVAEQGGIISPQTSISGMRSLFGTSYTPGATYKGTTTGTPLGVVETRFSPMKITAVPPRSSIGLPKLPSPTSSMNYLDSVEPGEEVQAQALDMVDKLVWLNTADVAPSSPPRKYKKSFPGLPPAIPTLTNPALQVFEFEDTPLVKGPQQAYGDLSLIKEIQAGWKKKAEQNHQLTQTTRKGKEKGTGTAALLLPEGERLSKLLTENALNKICEPRANISAKLQGKGEVLCLDSATLTTKSSALESVVAQDCRGDNNVANETKRVRGNLAEVADDDLLNVVGNGLRKRFSSRGVKSYEHNRDPGEREGKVVDGTQILTRRRSQGTRNRREHIRVPDAVLLSGNHSSPEVTVRTDCEMEKNPSTARKRRSLNIMLRDRSAKKARSTVEEEDVEEAQNEAHEDQQNEAYEYHENEAHEDMDILSSPTSSGADPMFIVPHKTTSNRRRKAIITDNVENKEEAKAVVDTAETMPPKGKKRMRLSEAAKLILAADNIADMRSEEGVKTRSLRQLRRSCNNDAPLSTKPTIPQVVQKRLRSVRRGSGGAPKTSTFDEDCDLQNDGSTSTWSATFQGDSDNDGMEVNGVSSPDQSGNENDANDENEGDEGDEGDDENEENEEISYHHVDIPVEDVGRLKMTRTRNIADVSSPSTSAFQPAPVTGRRGRGAFVKPEIIITEEANNVQFAYPAFVVPPAGKGLRMRTVRKRRDPQMLLALPPSKNNNAVECFNPEGSPSVSTEGSLRTLRRGTNVSVLFSHGLSEDTVKKQRKIVEKLDGKVTRKASDCTHFVAEKFVRTGNMLEAMAAGKFVVTFAWLESCQMANCFIEERNFLLQDEKKERELGFSMRSTILAAQHKPLLQGSRVVLTPNISPKPQAIAAIVQAAGGQVVEEYEGPAPDAGNEDFCIVIANDDDLEICVPFLDQGAKVYRAELILSGIISHHLDFSKHVLFETYRGGRRRGVTLRQT